MGALLKAYRHLNQLRDSAAFRAQLAPIARRVCWQLKERELAAADPSPETAWGRRQMKTMLDEAIAALPPLYRSVQELRDIEDGRGDQVAQQLGISRAAMKSRLNRARDLVRQHLDQALTGQSAA